jgi:hypothetical protein
VWITSVELVHDALVGWLDLLRQIAEVRVGRSHVDSPFHFTPPAALDHPSPQQEDHGDKGQGRSPPRATSAPKIKLDGTVAMPMARL